MFEKKLIFLHRRENNCIALTVTNCTCCTNNNFYQSNAILGDYTNNNYINWVLFAKRVQSSFLIEWTWVFFSVFDLQLKLQPKLLLHYISLEICWTQQITFRLQFVQEFCRLLLWWELSGEDSLILHFKLHCIDYKGNLELIVKFYWSALAALFSLFKSNKTTLLRYCSKKN